MIATMTTSAAVITIQSSQLFGPYVSNDGALGAGEGGAGDGDGAGDERDGAALVNGGGRREGAGRVLEL